MFLEGSHVEVIDLQPMSYEIICLQIIIKIRTAHFPIPLEGEIEPASSLFADHTILKEEVDVGVHRKRSDRCYYLNIFSGGIILWTHRKIYLPP